MAYKYESWITHLIELRLATEEGIDYIEETRARDELKEAYVKAKAFDEIRKYVNKKLEEEKFPIEDDYLIGRYESYEIIEEIIKEYMEDK